MTFCLGMKVEDGLIGIADTRVTTGAECIMARKVSIHQHGRHSMFLMTSGLRSVRDKAVTYFDEAIGDSDQTFDKLFKAVNVFAAQIRRVAEEDKATLDKAGLHLRSPRIGRRAVGKRPGAQALSHLPSGKLGGSERRHTLLHHRRNQLW